MAATLSRGTHHPHIVEQHAEEAAFLWLAARRRRRRTALRAPPSRAGSTSGSRRISTGCASRARPAARSRWPSSSSTRRWASCSPPACSRSRARTPQDRSRRRDRRGGAGDDPRPDLGARLGGARAPARHGRDLPRQRFAQRRLLGLAALLGAPGRSGLVSARACARMRSRSCARARCASSGELGRAELAREVRAALRDEDAAAQFWAAWSAGLIGERDAAIPILQGHAEGTGAYKGARLDLVLRIMPQPAAMHWLRSLNSHPEHARLAVVACGIVGDPAFVPWLIGRMAGAGARARRRRELLADHRRRPRLRRPRDRRARGLRGRPDRQPRRRERRPRPGRGPALARSRADPRLVAGERRPLCRRHPPPARPPARRGGLPARAHRRLPAPAPRRRVRAGARGPRRRCSTGASRRALDSSPFWRQALPRAARCDHRSEWPATQSAEGGRSRREQSALTGPVDRHRPPAQVLPDPQCLLEPAEQPIPDHTQNVDRLLINPTRTGSVEN